MEVKDIAKELNLEIISGENAINNEVTGGYASDLLSDVMGKAKEGQIWITLQNHKNIVAVASLKDLAAIILINGTMPDAETIKVSNSDNIPILSSKETNFDLCGKLYNILKK